MKRSILVLIFFFGFFVFLHGQQNIPDSLISLFKNQLVTFPQEKIYLHIDKPYYIAGEQIWFRVYLTDASSHLPTTDSRYVYVELIDPLDSIVIRTKIQQEDDIYHGYLQIPDDATEGDYTIRAYTRFMQNQDEHYFFTKTIRIGDPQSHTFHADAEFFFTSGKQDQVDVTLRFSRITLTGTIEPFAPKSVKVSVNKGITMEINPNENGTVNIHFDLPTASQKRTMYIEVNTGHRPFRTFFHIPVPDDDFDVTFYPEGGSLMQGTSCKLAFKAMKSDGQKIHVAGILYDQSGTAIREVKSEHLGMGSFPHISEKEKTYYLVCENDKGQSKRFELPIAVERGYALSVTRMRDNLYISVQQPIDVRQNDELYLLAHTRGTVHFADLWDTEKNLAIINQHQLPSGILQIVLFDANRFAVSERLVFINNNDYASVSYQSNENQFASRTLVKNQVIVTDSNNEPVEGNFSVSVTSDKEVKTDSTTNILTQLLLSSDLRGFIENPSFYFQNNNAAVYALDLLMCTQGWRRYDINSLAKGQIAKPMIPIERNAIISGTVKTLLQGRPVGDVNVTIIAQNDKKNFYNTATTDKDGRFYFPGSDFVSSTWFTINAEQRRGVTTRLELFVDKESFPHRTFPAISFTTIDKYQFAKYVTKADQKYTEEFGFREYQLDEVTVTAQRLPTRQSTYYSAANNSITSDVLRNFSIPNIRTLLMRIPGVLIGGKTGIVWGDTNEGSGSNISEEEANQLTAGEKYGLQLQAQQQSDRRSAIEAEENTNYSGISIRGGGKPLLLIDDIIIQYENIDHIEALVNVNDIEQIDVLKDGSKTAVFGMRGANGAIAIFTKKGDGGTNKSASFNTISFLPFGYQQPTEFYTPKYDTPERRNAQTYDMRTTIHWQPVVRTDSEGKATFDFYTADDPTSYSVIIEGITRDGNIIRQEKSLWNKNQQK